MILYIFVCKLLVASHVVLDLRYLTLVFTTRGRVEISHTVAHTCFILPKRYLDGCSQIDSPVTCEEITLNDNSVYHMQVITTDLNVVK